GRVRWESGEMCAISLPKRSTPPTASQKGMCFGSWSVQVERQMRLILEPGGVEVYIQTIAGNEGVDMIHTQVLILLSQSRERDAWGGFDSFQNMHQGTVRNNAVKKVLL